MPTTERVPENRVLYERTSRYRKWPIFKEGVDEFFATYYSHVYPFNREDKYHEVDAGEDGRLDLIAYAYYGTPLLWWVIAECNDIFHPVKEVTPGKVLRIPSLSYVFGTRLS